eukprot:TRINITY_DN6146_c1_g1_i1.p1 TRINITY_DN6146_c1_g1~~TRINITY_DN6146_c1_g1_i1.p1  ORF type:complete len:606 (-),score=39.99 TRINITY_DN6146_c1_g1_i1:462-2279(-)
MKRKNRKSIGKKSNQSQISIEEQLVLLAAQHGLTVDQEVEEKFKSKQLNKNALKQKQKATQINNSIESFQKNKKQKLNAEIQNVRTRQLFSGLTSISGLKFGTCQTLNCKCKMNTNQVQGEGPSNSLSQHVCTKCDHPLSHHKVVVELLKEEFGRTSMDQHLVSCYHLIRLARISLLACSLKTWVKGCLQGIQRICHQFSQYRQVDKQSSRTLRETFAQLKHHSNLSLSLSEGLIGRHEEIEITIALDEMYFRVYYYFLVSQGRNNCSFVAPPQYFRDIEQFGLNINEIVENFAVEELSEEGREQFVKMIKNELNELVSILNFRIREGLRLFYEEGVGFEGEMDKVLQKGSNQNQRIPCYQLLNSWRDICRDWCCHLYSYATPTEAALRKLGEFSPLVEIGAGTGYWGHLLQKTEGVEIQCYDIKLTDNEYHGDVPPYFSVNQGEVERLQELDEKYSLFLCYPPPASSMARLCLKNFKGTYVIHVGEWQGDTGDHKFEYFLQKQFKLIDEVQLPNWGNTAYALTVWKRKSKKGQLYENQVQKCNNCGENDVSVLKRCRLCRSFVFCSKECAQAKEREHKDEHAIRLIFLQTDIDFDGQGQFSRLG